MAPPETTTFGATIITPAKTEQSLPALTPAVSHDSNTTPYDHTISPCSPFYQHPPASNERVPAAYHNKSLDISVAEKGMYLGDELTPTPTSMREKNPFCSTISVNTSKECTMWPSRQTLVTEKLELKKRKRADRSCACAGFRHNWESLSKTQRLTVRIVLALILVGAMIGLGVGISKAVNGEYKSGSSVST